MDIPHKQNNENCEPVVNKKHNLWDFKDISSFSIWFLSDIISKVDLRSQLKMHTDL